MWLAMYRSLVPILNGMVLDEQMPEKAVFIRVYCDASEINLPAITDPNLEILQG